MVSSTNLALSLLLYLVAASPRTMQAQAKYSGKDSQKLSWTKPSDGEIFRPGDSVVGEWTSSKAVVSPSVSLCSESSSADDEDDTDCGETVWPEIKQDGEAYSFSLAVPHITSSGNFYLRLKDDFGNIAKSPSFNLNPSETAGKTSTDAGGTVSHLPASEGGDIGNDSGNNGNASGTGDSGANASGNGHPAQAPIADSAGRDSAPSSTGSAAGASVSGSKKPYSSPGSETPATSGDHHAGTNSPGNAGSASPLAQDSGKPIVDGSDSGSPNSASRPLIGSYDNPVPSQQVALSRAALPTAAIAVPLSLLGATLIASLGLCIVHRRSLAAQRAKNAHLIEVQRNTSVRTVGSKVPSLADSTSRSALIEDPDIEKAIDALCGYERRRSRQASLDRESSTIHESTSTRYPIPRQDVRRERTYERPYERPYNFTRTYSNRLARAPSPRSRCHSSSYPRSPSGDYESSFPTYHRCNGGARGHRYSCNQDEDIGASTTDSILSSYDSSLIPSRKLPRHHSFYAQPRLPERSHSRCTAPAMDCSRYHHDNDAVCDPVSSPHARSHRSW